MKKIYATLALLCISFSGFSQAAEFKLDFEGTSPLTMPAGVTLVEASGDVNVARATTVYATYTQSANSVVNDGGSKRLKMDYLAHLIFNETALGTGSYTIAGYYKGNSEAGTAQSNGFIAITGTADGGTTWAKNNLLHFYANGQMNTLMSIASGSGFSTLVASSAYHHFAFTFNATDNIYRMYRDGVLVGTSAAQPAWTGRNVYLGYRGGAQSAVDGTFTDPYLDTSVTPARNKDVQKYVDDITVYKRAITDTEALSLYTTGTLAVNTQNKTTFTSYPNPVTDRLYFSTNEVSSVTIYNVLGAKVKTLTVSNNSVDMSGITTGNYIVKCKNTNGVEISTIKVIKK